MTEQMWTRVDEYVEGLFVPEDEALRGALEASRAAHLPDIQVSASQGKFLSLLARVAGARRILEVGTLGGYSAIWLARALPEDGKLVTLELEPKHAQVAEQTLERAGLAEKVEVVVGPALESLKRLEGPFDFVFIDADKPNNPVYFEQALRLTRRGSLIVVDNVVRNGAVLDATSEDPRVQGVRRFNELCARERRVSAVGIQTVGCKGYDGFAIARVERD